MSEIKLSFKLNPDIIRDVSENHQNVWSLLQFENLKCNIELDWVIIKMLTYVRREFADAGT